MRDIMDRMAEGRAGNFMGVLINHNMLGDTDSYAITSRHEHLRCVMSSIKSFILLRHCKYSTQYTVDTFVQQYEQ